MPMLAVRTALLITWLLAAPGDAWAGSLDGKSVEFGGQSVVTWWRGDTSEQSWGTVVYFGADGNRFVYIDAEQGVVLPPDRTSGTVRIGKMKYGVKLIVTDSELSLSVVGTPSDSDAVLRLEYRVRFSGNGCKMTGFSYDISSPTQPPGVISSIKNKTAPCRILAGNSVK
jgi:hypothetical protein